MSPFSLNDIILGIISRIGIYIYYIIKAIVIFLCKFLVLCVSIYKCILTTNQLTMNGATSKSFMKNLSGSDFTSHKNKRRFFEAADINKAVGMQKGKSLFTTQHHLSPEPSIDINAVAKSNGVKMENLPLNSIERHDEYERRNWKHDETSELSKKDTFIRGARNMMQGVANTAREVLPYAVAGGTLGAVKKIYDHLAKKEGTALEESSNSEKDDTTKDEKESKTVNLNYTPDKATIVAMRKSYYGK